MSTDRTVSLHAPRAALWVLSLLLLAPWLAFGVWLSVDPRRTAAPPAPASAKTPVAATTPLRPAPASDVLQCKPGPWGTLEYYRTLLEPPEEFIVTDYLAPAPQPWVFKGYTPATLAALWDNAALTPAQRQHLDDPARRETTATALLLRPDTDTILSLSPESRAKIYTALADFPENFPQFNPYRLRQDFSPDWLTNAALPEAAVALTQRLFYTRGVTTCFSDHPIVLATLPTPAERSRYIKALSRKSSLIAQLVIAPGADITALDRYWGRGRRSKDITPLLQSLARRPQGGAIDIIHLLPPFARAHLHTYPHPSERPIDAAHDCHWTSLNFFKETPDERFSDIAYVRQVLLNDYYPVLGEPVLGDILMFVRQDNSVAHSCVYVADDIVFTKNGPAFSVPWLLSPIDSVMAYYASGQPLEIRRYRAK